MKTIIKSKETMKAIALIFGLVFGSVSMYANDNIASAEASSSYLMSAEIVEVETEMNIESWMLDLENASWENYQNEEEIELESWMLDLTKDNVFVQAEEDEQIVESWMTNPDSWLAE